MGTRSNTYIIETGHDDEFNLVNIYRQMDSYPMCHGKALSDFINSIELVNGLSLNKSKKTLANGAGCFAAQLVKELKESVGNIYLDNPQSIERFHDYTYEIRIDTFQPSKGIRILVSEWDKEVFDGDPKEFAKFCKNYKG